MLAIELQLLLMRPERCQIYTVDAVVTDETSEMLDIEMQLLLRTPEICYI